MPQSIVGVTPLVDQSRCADVNTMGSVLKPENLEMQKKCFSYISDWPKIHLLIYFV